MNLHEEHYILIKDFKYGVQYIDSVVSAYLSKSNEYIYINEEDLEFEDSSSLRDNYFLEDGFYKIPVCDIDVDHMIPQEVNESMYYDFLRGKISDLDFFGFTRPNNGVIFNGKLKLKLSYIRDYLENTNDTTYLYTDYSNASKYCINFKDAFYNYFYNYSDLEFKDEDTVIMMFLHVINLYNEGNFLYDYDIIKKSIDDECNYFDSKTSDRSYVLKIIFVEKHSQEANYYMFDKYPNLLNLYKTYLDDLIKLDDTLALRAKAYLDYEGAYFWPVNYIEAEELLTKLYLLGDYEATNTLGYLYMYHNTTSDTPDYNKAFSYFSIGSVFNITESRYKLSDCLINGYGTKKNVKIGFEMLKNVYMETREEFLTGHKLSKFADVALRMSNYYEFNVYNDDIEYSRRRKLNDIIEAKYALEVRQNTVDYIGDEIVNNKICDKYSLYNFLELEDNIPIKSDLFIRELLIDCFTLNYRLQKQIKAEFKAKDGICSIKIKIPKKLGRKMLTTFIDYGKTCLTNELEIRGYTNVNDSFTLDISKIRFFSDQIDDTVYLLVSSPKSIVLEDPYVVCPAQLKKTGKLHKFISVLENDQHLSYKLPTLCLANNFDLKQNDRVIIKEGNEKKTCTVYKTFVLYESELEMPVAYYPIVIEKEYTFKNNKEEKIDDFVA